MIGIWQSSQCIDWAMSPAIAFYLAIINLVTFLRFWQDKKRAIAGQRRIPEGDLLGPALLGGTPAAFLARRLFRHKTRKEPFSTYLHMIVTIQVGLITGFFFI